VLKAASTSKSVAAEKFVIMGPSGARASLLKHIIGLEPPDAGDILLEGESWASPG
jgi:ABC-type transporter Mla maintaining outer membrane lipid asymmetry ATPase subunit MlaF